MAKKKTDPETAPEATETETAVVVEVPQDVTAAVERIELLAERVAAPVPCAGCAADLAVIASALAVAAAAQSLAALSAFTAAHGADVETAAAMETLRATLVQRARAQG